MKYIPKTRITVPYTESVDTQYLDTLDPAGKMRWPHAQVGADLAGFDVSSQRHLAMRRKKPVSQVVSTQRVQVLKY